MSVMVFPKTPEVRRSVILLGIKPSIRISGITLNNGVISSGKKCAGGLAMDYHIEYEREEDGRWIAEVPQLPGVLAYGNTADDAMRKAEALALRVLAERLELAECSPMTINIAFEAV
jgi:predicted RNase H-like HicB family nuclease